MENDASPYDKLLARLARGSIRFDQGGDDVVAGNAGPPEDAVETYDAGTCCGDEIKVGFVMGKRYKAKRHRLTIGQQIAEGTITPCGPGEIRCYRREKQLCVAYFEGGARRSIELTCTTSESSADEGWFTWFGPVTSINTPWSDNDPSTVTFVTIDRLRRYAADRTRKT
jgi:hypothetical protein